MAPINIYDFTVPNLKHTLEALHEILAKTVSTSESKGLNLEELPSTRLTENMLPFSFQIQTVCNTAKFISVRVAGVPNVEMKDDEKTIEELQARIKKTVEFLDSVKREDFEGKDDAEVTFRDLKFTGMGYVTKYAIPNFYFHVSIAYAILRIKGIEIGKLDYLGPVKGDKIE